MKTLLIIVITIILCSCKSKDTSSIKVIDMLSPPELEITSLSDIATDVEYIPLQTSENSLIEYIQDIKTINDKIYIFPQEQILCFDKTGRYLYKLTKMGRGPGEYLSIVDFDINSGGDLLILKTYGKLLLYNIAGNDFVFYKSINISTDSGIQLSDIDFTPGQNSILLSYATEGSEPLRNMLINLDGKTLDTRPNHYHYKKNNKLGFASTEENIHFKYNNRLFFKEMLCDTVFIVDQSNIISPYLVLDCQENQVTPKIIANLSMENVKSALSECLRIVNIMEVSQYLVCFLNFNNSEYYEIYDKNSSKKFRFAHKTFLKDDITGGLNFEPKFCNEGKFYSWVDALVLKKYVYSENFIKLEVKNPEKKKALKKMADSLKETDNPVIIVITPKE